MASKQHTVRPTPGGSTKLVLDKHGEGDFHVMKTGFECRNGTVLRAGMNRPLPVTLGGTDDDSFGRLRVSNPDTLFDCKQLHDKAPALFDEELYGTATSVHSQANARTRMSTLASGDGVIRQSFQRMNYQPGKSQLILFTFLMTEEENTRKRAGYFETSDLADSVPQNGIYFEVNGTTDAAWCIAKDGVVAERVVQADWNQDTLEGSGLSGATLDLDSTQIGHISFEWLGVGSASVGFVINGAFAPVHTFQHANMAGFDSVYMSTPNLPVCYSIYQDGAGTGSMDHICSTVISEGGSQLRGIPRAVDSGTASVTFATTGTRYVAMAMRLKTGRTDAGVFFEEFATLVNTNDRCMIRVVYDATVSGSLTWVDAGSDSSIEYAVGDNTQTVTGGDISRTEYVSDRIRSAKTDSNEAVRIGQYIDGTMQIAVIEIVPLSGNIGTYTALKWRESP